MIIKGVKIQIYINNLLIKSRHLPSNGGGGVIVSLYGGGSGTLKYSMALKCAWVSL